jgi:hypothetical protein
MGLRRKSAGSCMQYFPVVLLALCLHPFSVSADERPESMNMRFVSPLSDAVFHPGDKVEVKLELLNGIRPGKVIVMPGFRSGARSGVPMREFDGPPYHYSFRLAEDFVGSIGLSALAMSRNKSEEAGYADFTLVVVPKGKPWGIEAGVSMSLLDVMGEESVRRHRYHETQIEVTGFWANSVRADLTSASKGTNYRALDTTIVEVDAEGLVQARNPGYTFVKVVNGFHEELLFVGVLDENGNLPEQDQAASLKIDYGPLRFDGRLVQPVTIQNISSRPLPRLSVQVPEETGMAYHISVHDDDIPFLFEPGRVHSFYLRFTDFGQSATRVPIRIVTE